MESPSELRAICQAGKGDAPGWYRIHRNLSIYITWALLHTPIRLNQVTLLMMFCGLAGAALLIPRRLEANALGFLVLYLSFLLDKVDGEIARYRGASAVHGILLDRFHHRLIEPCTLLAAAYREAQATSGSGVLLLALGSVFLGAVIEENQQLSPYLLLKHLRETGTWPERRPSRLAGAVGRLYAFARPLKSFRMFIAFVPMLAVVYGLEAVSGRPWITWYFVVSTIALAAFVVVQAFYYYYTGVDCEIERWGAVLGHPATSMATELPPQAAPGAPHSTPGEPAAGVTRPGGL